VPSQDSNEGKTQRERQNLAVSWCLAGKAGQEEPIFEPGGDVGRAQQAGNLLPLLYVLGTQEKGERVRFFTEKVTLNSISMRSLRIEWSSCILTGA